MSNAKVTVTGSKIKVLIVDDSAIVRKMLSASLSNEIDIEVVGGLHPIRL
jgi:chemotaxis response regulator CheB